MSTINAGNKLDRVAIGAAVGRIGTWVVLIAVLLLYVVPILMLFYGAFRSSAPGQPGYFTVDGFVEGFTNPQTLPTLLNSLWLALMVAIIAIVIAGVCAWIAANTRVWARGLITPFMMLMLALPPLFFALSWDLLGTPRLGLINQTLAPLGLNTFTVDGAWGTAFVIGLKVSSLVYFLLLGPFSSMDRRMEEAALVSGTGILRTLMRVTFPVMAPALAGGFILAFIIGLTAFEVPLIIGLSEGFHVFSTQIYSMMTASEPPNYAVSGALSIILITIVILLVAVRWWVLDRRSFTTVSGKGSSEEAWELGRWSWLANFFVLVVILLGFILPTLQMLVGSFQPIMGILSDFSWTNYERVLSDSGSAEMFANSLTISIVGGILAVAVAFLLAYMGRHGSTAMRRFLDLATWLPWAASGILLSLGLVWTFLSVPWLHGMFGTIWILLIGLVVATTPLASRTVDAALVQIDRELEEAGRVSGASAVRVAVGLVGRIMVPTFLAGWFISAVHIIGNLEVTILLSLPTNPTLAVRVYNLYTQGEATTAAALFCLVLGAGAAVGLLWLLGRAIMRRRRRNRDLEAVATPGDEDLEVMTTTGIDVSMINRRVMKRKER